MLIILMLMKLWICAAISGSVLQQKVKNFAFVLGVTGFKNSNDWLDGFKTDNELVFKTVYSENASIYQNTVDDWINDTLSRLCEGYAISVLFQCQQCFLSIIWKK